MPRLFLDGTVFSGTGQGKRFLELPWVKRQIVEKLGFVPYAGTLNLRLTPESIEKRRILDSTQGFVVEPQAGYLSGVLFKAAIGEIECAVVIPKVPNYPKDIIEIISPTYLRGLLKIKDGSMVTLSVTV